jgi:hypothetical protein
MSAANNPAGASTSEALKRLSYPEPVKRRHLTSDQPE